MNLLTFFVLQLKRILKHKLLLCMLLLFPVVLFFLSRSFDREADSRIPVGICLTTEDALAQTLCEKLVSLEDSLFSFTYADSEEALLKGVQSNRFECGYLFEKDLSTELNRNRLKNLITVYTSENTTSTGVLNELVYANLFEEYSLSLLQDTLREAGHLPFSENAVTELTLPPVTQEEIETLYRSHLTDGSTFRIEIVFGTAAEDKEAGNMQAATFPLLRGLTAVFLLLWCFPALLTIIRDKANGLYVRLHGKTRLLCPCLTMSAYLLPSGLICLLGLGISGSITTLGTELLAMVCYLLALSVFYLILGALLRNHTLLCAAFPVLVLCTLVFTPVITDLSVFFPWIKAVRYLFPTYYYLMFF